MKNSFIAFILLIANTSLAQPYTFSTTTSTYSDLTGATVANGTSIWNYSTSFTIPIGFTFNFMGNNFTSVEVDGRGSMYFDALHYYILLPFGVAFKDKGTSTSLSPISYLTEGTAPNRIFKVEWKNVDYFHEPGSTANFQCWFYESSNAIEIHVGMCGITDPGVAYSWNSDNGPSIGVFEYSSTLMTYGFGLSGTTFAPTEHDMLGGVGADIWDYSLAGTPAVNRVYRFEAVSDGINQNENISDLDLYVESGSLNVKSANKPIELLVIYNTKGQMIYSQKPISFDTAIPIINFTHNEIYFVKVSLNDGSVVTRKLFI